MPINSTLDVIIQEDDLVVLGPPTAIEIDLNIGAQGDPGSQIYSGNFDPNTINETQFLSLYGSLPEGNDLFLRNDIGQNYGTFYSYVSVPGGIQWEPILEIQDAVNSFFVSNPDFIISASSGGTGKDNGPNTFTFSGNIEFSGPYSTIFNLQGNTDIILPTSGSVAVWQDKLNVFSPTTSSEFASIITDETGTGSLVFGTSPQITQSLNTDSSTFNLINSTATVVNFAGEATSLNLGSSTGLTTINNDLLVSASHYATVDALQLDTSPEVNASVGRIIWDDGDGTAHITLKGGNVDLSIGQEEVALCYNGSGSPMTDGQVVYIAGAQGQRPDIRLASSSTESSSSKTFGIVTEPIADGEEGFVATFGLVKGIDTSAFAEGSALWLSASAGVFTDQMPQSPQHAVFIGYVVKSNQSSGEIFVNIQNGYEINELHDVLITSASANDILIYDELTSLWINKSVSTIIGEIPSTVVEKTTPYTLSLVDAQKIIEVNSASAITITIPLDSSTEFPIGSNIEIIQTGIGQVEIGAEVGVTLLSKDSNKKLSSQYSWAKIYKKSSNAWVLFGDLSS